MILNQVVSAMDPTRSKVLIMDAVRQCKPSFAWAPNMVCPLTASIPGSPVHRYLAFAGYGRSLDADLWGKGAHGGGLESLAGECRIGH